MATRRDFIASSACLLLASGLAKGSPETVPVPVGGSRKGSAKEAFSLGLAGYSMRDFTVGETLSWFKHWDLRHWAIKDVHLPLSSSTEQMEQLLQKCQVAGVRLYAAGVIYMKTESEVERAFAYAKRLGVGMIVGVANPELLPAVERAVKATDIRLAIHNHGPDMELYPTPQDVYGHIKSFDPRIGLCIDIGHTQRCGIDPSEALLECADRTFDIHVKDVDKAARDGRTAALGHGIIDLHRLVRTLRQVKFSGVCALEYESRKELTLPGLSETLGYLRGVLNSS